MALKRNVVKIGRLSTIYMIGSIAPKVLGLFLLPVFTHYLVPEQFGIIRLALQISQVLAVVLQLGFGASLKSFYFKFEGFTKEEIVKTAFLGHLALSALLCTILSVAGIWLAAPLLPNLPLNPDLIMGLWLMIVWGCFFDSKLRLATIMVQLQERASTSVVLNLAKMLSQDLIGVVGVVWLGWLGFGRQGSVLMGSFVGGVISIWVLWRFGRGQFSLSLFKKLLTTGLTFIPHSLAGILSLSINTWILNKMISSAAIGVYGIAIMFAQFIVIPITSIGNGAYPTLAKLMKDGSRAAKEEQSRLYTLIITGVALVTLAIVMFAPVAIDVLTDPKYHEAKTIVYVLGLAWFLQGIYLVGSHVVFYYGGGLWLGTATITSVIVNVVLSLVLIPRYGIFGAAFAMAGCFLIRALIVLVVGQRMHPLPWQIGQIVRALIATGVLGTADFVVSPMLDFSGSFALKIVLAALVIPVLVFLGVVKTNELNEIKKLLLNKWHALTKHD